MFLPISPKELDGAPDFVYVIGEAYCDHPSFGHAIVSRLFVSLGYTVAMLPQPQCDGDYMRFGAPRLGFLVTGGVVDSTVSSMGIMYQGIRMKIDMVKDAMAMLDEHLARSLGRCFLRVTGRPCP